MNRIISIFNQTVINYKYIFSNVHMLILLVSFLLFPELLCLIFVPFRFAIPIAFVIGAVLPSSLFLISRRHSWRTGALEKQLQSNNSTKLSNEISLFLFFTINVYILSFVLILIFHILGISNLLIANYFGGRMEDYNNIIKLFNIGFMYSMFEMIIVMYSMIFLFQTFIKSEKILYIILMSIMVVDIIYGALFNNYFKDIGKLSYDASTGSFESGIVYYTGSHYPDFFYYPTVILFPLFGPSEHLSTNKFIIDSYEEFKFFNWSNPNDVITYWHSDETFTLNNNAFRWNILWIMPYIHSIAMFCTSIVISKIKEA